MRPLLDNVDCFFYKIISSIKCHDIIGTVLFEYFRMVKRTLTVGKGDYGYPCNILLTIFTVSKGKQCYRCGIKYTVRFVYVLYAFTGLTGCAVLHNDAPKIYLLRCCIQKVKHQF